MSLRDRLRSLRATPDDHFAPMPGYRASYDADGATFTTDPADLALLRDGQGQRTAQEQHVVLEMLAEQGDATEVETGFTVTADVLARLDEDEATILGLKPRFTGEFVTRVVGTTDRPTFRVQVQTRVGRYPQPWERRGATLKVGSQMYRLSPPALHALRAVDEHSALAPEERTPVRNVRLVAELQAARRLAASDDPQVRDETFRMDLGALERFTTTVPSSVRVTAETRDDGSLWLSPDLGTASGPDALATRWGQLRGARDGGVLRVENELVLLDEQRLAGVREVLGNRHIPAHQRREFEAAPEAFLDATVVDVELGFSVRVRGVGLLAPVSFAEASESGIEWFSSVDTVLPPESLADRPGNLAEHEDLDAKIDRAWSTGEDVVPVGEELVDVSDHERVNQAMRTARERLERERDALRDHDDEVTPGAEEASPSGTKVTVGIWLHEAGDAVVQARAAAEAARPERPVDYASLLRTPFAHQREGIEWMAGLMHAALAGDEDDPARVRGALLADDMGLGKTFMTLVALRELARAGKARGSIPRPVLAVMPVSLLENWAEEVDKTFEHSPFDDVVILQGAGLAEFRKRGAGRETVASAQDIGADGMVRDDAIRFSLLVGEAYGPHRLDVPGRLVLTTYDTLRSYQLSLAQVDWGAVVLDEAQHTKNPEISLTRAAKALKARFTLLATGTPVENSLQDFWCLMDTAQPGLLGTWAEFRERWSRPIDEAEGESRARLGRELRELVGPFMLRRSKEDHLTNLPTKTVHSPFLPGSFAGLGREMPAAQRETYDDVLAQHRASTGRKGAALTTVQRLRAVSLHPVPRDATADDVGEVRLEDSARMVALLAVLDRVRERGEKVIVFVIDKTVQRQLRLWLQERYGLPVRVVNGDTQAVSTGGGATRRSIIRAFENAVGFNVIIMSPLAVGTGLTVTGANHAVHLERHWNPAKEAQATDRIYRIGQTRDVHVYLPMALHPDVDSFDVNLDRLLRGKTVLKDAVVVPESVSGEELMAAMDLRG